MGTWGNKIKNDDFVMDVIDEFISSLKVSQDLAQTTKDIKHHYASDINDPDDGPLFWLGLAEVQWQFGYLQDNTLSKVKDDFLMGRGFDRWEEEGKKDLDNRKKAISDFISKIEKPNTKPKKLPKTIVRAPKYNTGDCLSISLRNNLFTAAIVLSSDHRNPEYGSNLIGMLNYLSTVEPTQEVFEDRKWLIRTHHYYKGQPDLAWYTALGHRKFKDMIKIAGRTEIREDDPTDSDTYSGWEDFGGQVILQHEWDKTTQQQNRGDKN
jgi:hypothetical protein